MTNLGYTQRGHTLKDFSYEGLQHTDMARCSDLDKSDHLPVHHILRSAVILKDVAECQMYSCHISRTLKG